LKLFPWLILLILGIDVAYGSTRFDPEKMLGIEFEKVEIETIKVASGIYLLKGAGGNIGACIGDDGVLLIDDQFAPLSAKVKAAIATISDKPIRFVLNTHYHPDHIGGNEYMAERGAVIIAHNNVRKRLSTTTFNQTIQAELPPVPEGALPVVTYSDTISFYINGEEVHAFHVPPAHTDGDSFVHFIQADVIHAGDVFRTSSYPVVDVAAGGSYEGIINGYARLLEMAGPDTKIIPGHGEISSRFEIESQYQMLMTIRDRIQTAVNAGKSLAEVQAMRPTSEYDEVWGGGRISAESIVKIVFNELAQ
jgi:glyoxylase-like metal-dependent hydrolase (beta-lactamase superfamily II)